MNDLDEDLEPRARRPGADAPQGSAAGAPRGGVGQSVRFALVMVGACVVVSLSAGQLLPELSPPRAKVSIAAAMVSSARKAPKAVGNRITYAADPSGHFFVDAAVNGVPIRFLVDTGATFVALSLEDAARAGIAAQTLRFDEAASTANGIAHAARTSLRTVRLGQLEIAEVSAVVMEQPMPISLLGMSFLSRVDGYGIRDGVLTIEW